MDSQQHAAFRCRARWAAHAHGRAPFTAPTAAWRCVHRCQVLYKLKARLPTSGEVAARPVEAVWDQGPRSPGSACVTERAPSPASTWCRAVTELSSCDEHFSELGSFRVCDPGLASRRAERFVPGAAISCLEM